MKRIQNILTTVLPVLVALLTTVIIASSPEFVMALYGLAEETWITLSMMENVPFAALCGALMGIVTIKVMQSWLDHKLLVELKGRADRTVEENRQIMERTNT